MINANDQTVFAAFDIESTGLFPIQERMIEVAAIKFTLGGEILGEFSELMHPGKWIPEAATKIHRITNEDVADAPKAGEILPRFHEFLGQDTVLVAHNAEFDASFMGAEYLLEGLEMPKNQIWDTLEMSRALVPGIMNHKLETLVHHFAFPAREFHRALDDSMHLVHLMRRFHKDGNSAAKLGSLTTVRYFQDAKKLFSVSLPLNLSAINRALKQKLSLSFEYEDGGQRREETCRPDFLYRTEKFEWLQGLNSEGERQDWRMDRISRPKALA